MTEIFMALLTDPAPTTKERYFRDRELATFEKRKRDAGRSAKVLVTGAGGRLGPAVVQALALAGYQVVALYRSRPAEIAGVEWVAGDILKPEGFIHHLQTCDAVIHLAAELSDVRVMDAVNVEATGRLLELSRGCGVRYFGFASSVVVYGSPAEPEIDERCAIIDPDQPLLGQYFAEPSMLDYARTKAAAERELRRGCKGLALDIYRPTVVRNENEMFEITSMGLLKQMLIWNRCSQFILTEDFAAAVCFLMQKGLNRGSGLEVFNIADHNAPTYSDIMRGRIGTPRFPQFGVPIGLPSEIDNLRTMLKYRRRSIGTALGYLNVSNRKLLQAGFMFPTGVLQGLRVEAQRQSTFSAV
jgi:nucleoside-diphosphate-sugar epimerase